MPILEVHHIEKHFGATRVLEDISFDLEQGQALAIIGSSGSGKTTLLRCLNFLETPDQGQIVVQGDTLFDADDPATQRESEVRKKRLHFGLVFQSFNLFPQYTALRNVTLAKELLSQERPDFKANRKQILEEIQAEGRELLAKMGLSERADHYPSQLSGGQQLPALGLNFFQDGLLVLLILGQLLAEKFLGQGDIFQRRVLRKEIKGLEHQTKVEALLPHLGLPLGEGIVGVKNHIAVDGNGAVVGGLQKVEAAQQGGLAAARGANDGQGLALLQGEADILQHPGGAEMLFNVFYL